MKRKRYFPLTLESARFEFLACSDRTRMLLKYRFSKYLAALNSTPGAQDSYAYSISSEECFKLSTKYWRFYGIDIEVDLQKYIEFSSDLF